MRFDAWFWKQSQAGVSLRLEILAAHGDYVAKHFAQKQTDQIPCVGSALLFDGREDASLKPISVAYLRINC